MYKSTGCLLFKMCQKMPCSDQHIMQGIGSLVLVLAVMMSAGMVMAVSAESDSIEAYMGETITFHGVSYGSTTVYLFLTGPNLPANGVPLNDIMQRADQGAFTLVDVDSDQQWSYRWDTSRLHSRLDYGTYTVYVVADPADRSQLAGHQFSTQSVYLKNPGLSGVVVSGGTSYTLNPEDRTSTQKSIAPSITTLLPSATPTTIVPVVSFTPVIPPSPTPKSGGCMAEALIKTGSSIAGLLVAIRRGS
jgi:hypothetical protein